MNEKADLLLAAFVLSVAFSMALFGYARSIESIALSSAIIFFLVMPSFILHELAHRFSANYFKAKARFVMWKLGVLLSIVTSFFGFIIAAPGAVYILSKLTREQYGIVSIAGALVNITLAILFALLSAFFYISLESFNALYIASKINAFLAFFNLLPLGPLDGKKVFDWSREIWGLTIGIAFLLMALI